MLDDVQQQFPDGMKQQVLEVFARQLQCRACLDFDGQAVAFLHARRQPFDRRHQALQCQNGRAELHGQRPAGLDGFLDQAHRVGLIPVRLVPMRLIAICLAAICLTGGRLQMHLGADQQLLNVFVENLRDAAPFPLLGAHQFFGEGRQSIRTMLCQRRQFAELTGLFPHLLRQPRIQIAELLAAALQFGGPQCRQVAGLDRVLQQIERRPMRLAIEDRRDLLFGKFPQQPGVLLQGVGQLVSRLHVFLGQPAELGAECLGIVKIEIDLRAAHSGAPAASAACVGGE
ncbi:MAG TPA: hypothetical protein VGM05_00080 [Planctomycetaceae bacterium]